MLRGVSAAAADSEMPALWSCEWASRPSKFSVLASVEFVGGGRGNPRTVRLLPQLLHLSNSMLQLLVVAVARACAPCTAAPAGIIPTSMIFMRSSKRPWMRDA